MISTVLALSGPGLHACPGITSSFNFIFILVIILVLSCHLGLWTPSQLLAPNGIFVFFFGQFHVTWSIQLYSTAYNIGSVCAWEVSVRTWGLSILCSFRAVVELCLADPYVPNASTTKWIHPRLESTLMPYIVN